MPNNFATRWESAVWNSDLPPMRKFIALAYGSFADYDTGSNCRPSIEQVAERASCSARTVTNARRDLIATGWLEQVQRGGTGRASLHRLTFPAHATGAQATDDAHASSDVPTGTTCHPPTHGTDDPPSAPEGASADERSHPIRAERRQTTPDGDVLDGHPVLARIDATFHTLYRPGVTDPTGFVAAYDTRLENGAAMTRTEVAAWALRARRALRAQGIDPNRAVMATAPR